MLLLVAALIFKRWPAFRISRTPIVLVISLGLSLLLVLGYAEIQANGGTVGILGTTCNWASRSLSSILLIAWAERMYHHPERNSIAVFAVSLMIVGLIRVFLYFLQSEASAILTSLFPAISGALLGYINARCRKDSSLLGADGQHLLAHRMDLSTPRRLFYSFSLTAFCATFLFKSVRNMWLLSQSSMQVTMVTNLGTALGSILVGLVIYLIVRFDCSREILEVCRLFALPFILLALYLASHQTLGAAFEYLACLEFAQKVLLFLVWLVPYWYSDDEKCFVYACTVFIAYRMGQLLASLQDLIIPSGSSGTAYDVLRFIFIILLITQLFVVIFIIVDVSKESGRRAEQREAEVRESARVAEIAALPKVDESARVLGDLAKEHGLTSKEREVLEFLAAGRTVDHIAQKMVVSVNTVRSHRQHIYAKMGLHSQQELLDLIEERKG